MEPNRPADTSRQFKLAHQILNITDINFERKIIIGFTELTIVPFLDNVNIVRLNVKQCQIHRITVNDEFEISKEHIRFSDPFLDICQDIPETRNLHAFSKRHLNAASDSSGELTISIPPQISHLFEEGIQVRIGLKFSLENPHGGIHFVVPRNEGTYRQRGVHLYTYVHQNSTRLWFPCIDGFADKCTWKMNFTVHKDMLAVSNGDLTQTVLTQGSQRKIFHYTLNTPTSAPNISLAVGPFEVHVDPEMHNVTHFCPPQLIRLLKVATKWLHETFKFYQGTLSSRYPYSCYKQVFVDQTTENYHSYASMSILSVDLLHFANFIDQVYITRIVMAEALAEQFFGCFISIENGSDIWVTKGISKYLCGLYWKKTFGYNDYIDMIHNTLQDVLKYEEQYGGIILDPTPLPDPQPRKQCKERFHFSIRNLQTLSPMYIEAMNKKAAFVIRMIEKRIGEELLRNVFNNQLTLAANAAKQFSGKAMLISTEIFEKAIETVAHKRVDILIDKWVRTGGHAKFKLTSVFNRCRNTIELEINQQATTRFGIRSYYGPIFVTLQQLDGPSQHMLQITDTFVKADIRCHSKTKRTKKKMIPLSNGDKVDMDLSAMDDSPVLWIRFDPDMTFLRSVVIEQREDQWQNELRHERDVISQLEAIVALRSCPSPATRLALTDTIENEKCFYKVRCKAAHCLTNVANAMVSNWGGPLPMLGIFRKMFSSKTTERLIKENNFSNFPHYFLQKTIPLAMAGLRNSHGICPPEVIKFLLDLLYYNDNEKNRYSDDNYRASLVEALGRTLTPVVSVQGVPITYNNPLIRSVCQDVFLLFNTDQNFPSYKYVVSVACLKTVRKLEKLGYLPSRPQTFKDFTEPGYYIDFRIAALECFVDLVRTDGSFDDLEYLLDLIKNDPEPGVRHKLVEIMIKNPPFRKGRGGRLDVPPLVEKMWSYINNLVDLYHTLYGTKTPVCSPITNKPENQIPDIPAYIPIQEMSQVNLEENQGLAVEELIELEMEVGACEEVNDEVVVVDEQDFIKEQTDAVGFEREIIIEEGTTSTEATKKRKKHKHKHHKHHKHSKRNKEN